MSGFDSIPKGVLKAAEEILKLQENEGHSEHCTECDGEGRVHIPDGPHGDTKEVRCSKCKGEGRVEKASPHKDEAEADAHRLAEIHEHISQHVHEAERILRKPHNQHAHAAAHAYWIGHIKSALGGHGYRTHATTLSGTIKDVAEHHGAEVPENFEDHHEGF